MSIQAVRDVGGSARPQCPKSMWFGPCGGVRADGGCEVDGRPCPFVDKFEFAVESNDRLPISLRSPSFIVDVRAPAMRSADLIELWRATAETLQGCIALLGEHVDNPGHEDDSGLLQPVQVIEILRSGGVPTIATISGRNRNESEARAMIRRLHVAGALAVHCVTGDHPRSVGIDRDASFGMESMTLIRVCNEEGVAATVAESPASPGHRAHRVAAKQRAGASACILNHMGDTAVLFGFLDAATDQGATIPFVAPIPMIGDRASALGLAKFPGLRLPSGMLERVAGADDPRSEALSWVTAMTREIAFDGRCVGVNLSGSAGGVGPWQRLERTKVFIDAVASAWGEGGGQR